MYHKRVSNKAVLLLGSNLGDRLAHLSFACEELKKSGIEIAVKSNHYETEAWGFSGGAFINQAIVVETTLLPLQLLDLTQNIEQKSGRTSHNHESAYESRTLDVDILFFNDQIIENERLMVPHPKIHIRRFALEPLNEICASYKHPVLMKTIEELKDECPDGSVVTEIPPIISEK